MMNLIRVLVVPLLGIFLTRCTRPINGNSFSEVQSDPPASLRVTLEKFAKTRNHVTNAKAKDDARDFITKSFLDLGLHVWSEKVVLQCSKVSAVSGENIVGMLKASRTNTSDDKIVIVGAHYDTEEDTPGVDDNGSGVTALLEIAKQIARADCFLTNTIMFIAFDFEESNECRHWLLGSDKFVQNLTSYLQQTGGTVNGAFILESMINYNSSAGSQTLRPGMEVVMKDTYDEVKNDSFRGNFIAVVGRRESDKKLLSLVRKYYKNDSNYRAQLAPIPVAGRPPQSPNWQNFGDFYRSDHFNFWNNTVSFSALMLTDTTEFRGYMKSCYHKQCDNLLHVHDSNLEFLRRTINAVIQSVLDLSRANSCDYNDASTSRVSLQLPLLIIMAFTCAFIAVR